MKPVTWRQLIAMIFTDAIAGLGLVDNVDDLVRRYLRRRGLKGLAVERLL
jgi:hypothetical protein